MDATKENPPTIELSFDDILEQYSDEVKKAAAPEELKNQWLELLEDSVDENALEKSISEIRRKIEGRKSLDNKKFATTEEEHFFENNIRLTKKIKKIVKEASLGNFPEAGKGMTATAYTGRKYPDLCYKIITNPEEYKKSCNIKEEMSFLDTLQKINVNGVRVPKPYYYYMSSEIHMCVMEKLRAATLQDIIDRKHSLPEDFDIEARFRDLKEFFQSMHDKYNIRHGDFHEGNIMFDLDDGTIYVIDFGRAFHAFASDGYTYKQGRDFVVALDDDQQIQKLYVTLKKFMHQEKVLDKMA